MPTSLPSAMTWSSLFHILFLLLLYCNVLSTANHAQFQHNPPELPITKRGPKAPYTIILKSSLWPPETRQRRNKLLSLLQANGATISDHQGARSIQATLDRATVHAVRQLPFIRSIIHRPTLLRSIRNQLERWWQRAYHPGQDARHLHADDITGRGIRIGIIDSGIDYTMPALGGGFGKGFRVVYGRNFVSLQRDNNNAYGLSQDDPMDRCRGHGTAVALVAAGDSDDYQGVAPQATLGAYRVTDCRGSVDEEGIWPAIKQADDDDMHIINISLGFRQLAARRTHSLISQMSNRGILFVVSAGNSRQEGLWSMETPAPLDSVLTVGAANVPIKQARWFSLDRSSGDYIHYTVRCGRLTTGSASAANSLLVRVAVDQQTGCQLPGSLHAGHTVMLEPGNCELRALLTTAKKIGVRAVILDTATPAATRALHRVSCLAVVGRIRLAPYPAVLEIPSEDHAPLQRYIERHGQAASISWSRTKRPLQQLASASASVFSTWGPGHQVEVKPDISAPGDRINVTTNVATASLGPLYGTSFAAPYVAGAVALYLQQRPRYYQQQRLPTPQISLSEVRTVLQNAAEPMYIRLKHTLSPVVHQGAGFLRLDRLFYSATQVSPSAVRIGQPAAGTSVTVTLTIMNKSPQPVQYAVKHLPCLSVARVPVKVLRLARTLHRSAPAGVPEHLPGCQAAPHDSCRVSIPISAPSGLSDSRQWLYSGYFKVQPLDGGAGVAAVHVPYVGLKGQLEKVAAEFGTDINTWLHGHELPPTPRPV